MGNFLSAKADDDLHVTITLKRHKSTFVNVLGSLGIVSADKYDEKPMHKSQLVLVLIAWSASNPVSN